MGKTYIDWYANRYSKAFTSEFSPWKSNYEGMAKKTVIKQLLKYAPLKTEFQRALSTDETIKNSLNVDMGEVLSEDIIDMPWRLPEMKTEEMTMSFEEFTAFMREKVQLVLGTDVIVVSKSVLKNNGTRLQGLEFFKETVRISPVIYLDGIYKEYERGRSMADCVKEVCSLYTVNQWEKEKTEKIFHMICSWEESRTKIYPILLPYEKNRELLKNVIHKKYLDLALCCCLTLEDEERNNMSVRVTEGILQQWEISEEDLFRQAYENMQIAGYHIINMMQIIKECGFEGEMPATKMFVLTNRKQLYGAAGILETDLLKNFSDRIGKNLFILPSSIHEVILIPDEGRFGESLLKEMIMDVNENVLQEEDFLADHAYYFDREKGEVRVA